MSTQLDVEKIAVETDSSCASQNDGSAPVLTILEALRISHQAVARYRVYISRRTPRIYEEEVASNLTLDAASAFQETVTARLKLDPEEDVGRFCGALCCIELENPDECLSPAARARLAITKGASRRPRK